MENDKLGHFLTFFALSLVGFICWFGGRILLFSTGMAVYGLMIECVQYTVENRTFSLMDWLVDLVGIAVALGVFTMLRNHLPKTAVTVVK